MASARLPKLRAGKQTQDRTNCYVTSAQAEEEEEGAKPQSDGTPVAESALSSFSSISAPQPINAVHSCSSVATRTGGASSPSKGSSWTTSTGATRTTSNTPSTSSSLGLTRIHRAADWLRQRTRAVKSSKIAPCHDREDLNAEDSALPHDLSSLDEDTTGLRWSTTSCASSTDCSVGSAGEAATTVPSTTLSSTTLAVSQKMNMSSSLKLAIPTPWTSDDLGIATGTLKPNDSFHSVVSRENGSSNNTNSNNNTRSSCSFGCTNSLEKSLSFSTKFPDDTMRVSTSESTIFPMSASNSACPARSWSHRRAGGARSKSGTFPDYHVDREAWFNYFDNPSVGGLGNGEMTKTVMFAALMKTFPSWDADELEIALEEMWADFVEDSYCACPGYELLRPQIGFVDMLIMRMSWFG